MYEAAAIGASAGGIEVLKILLPALPADFPLSLLIVQHIHEHSGSFLAEYLNQISPMPVKEAEDKEPLRPSHAYLAPAGYHLLVEPDKSFSLSVDGRVNYACPSIDVLFESAADAYGASLIGCVLTGANGDGSHGLKNIKQRGGLAIVQNPETAYARAMPQAALKATAADYLVEPQHIASLLVHLSTAEKETYGATG